MGLRVSIYRDDYRCSLNRFDGVNDLTIVNLPGPFEPDDKAPAAIMVPGHINGYRVVPAIKLGTDWVEWLHTDVIGPMAGGSFAWTSDSRFRKVSEAPVAIHDRYETQAQYDLFSS